MSVSIDWGTKVIYVPKTFLEDKGSGIYEFDTNDFRLALKDLEDDPEGMPFPKTHNHNTEVTLGGLSYARVIEILPPYTVTFEDGQYAINLTGSNNNIADRTNVNQVSVRPNNSAGLISSKGIEALEYRGGVTIDVVNGESGTLHPIGTLRRPVNNVEDAILISKYRGTRTFYIIGDIDCDNHNLDSLIIIGENPRLTTLTLSNSCSTNGTEFSNLSLEGECNGEILANFCRLDNITNLKGEIRNCILGTSIGIGGSSSEAVLFLGCWLGSKTVGGVTTFDMGGDGSALNIREHSGAIKIINKAGNSKVAIDFVSGRILLDSTITAGTFYIRGVGELSQNNATGITLYNNLVDGKEIRQLREGNIKYEYIEATVQNDDRNVAVGKLDRMIIKIKNDSDSDWSSPVDTKTLYMWYSVLGDENPIYIGESD